MKILIETPGDGRRVGVGQDERREQLVRRHRSERLDIRLLGRERSDTTMELPILGLKPVHDSRLNARTGRSLRKPCRRTAAVDVARARDSRGWQCQSVGGGLM